MQEQINHQSSRTMCTDLDSFDVPILDYLYTQGEERGHPRSLLERGDIELNQIQTNI